MISGFAFDQMLIQDTPAAFLRRMADMIEAGKIVEARPVVAFLTERRRFRLCMYFGTIEGASAAPLIRQTAETGEGISYDG